MAFSEGKAAVSILFGNQVERINALPAGAPLDEPIVKLAAIGAHYCNQDPLFKREWGSLAKALQDPEAAHGSLAPQEAESAEAWRLRLRMMQYTALCMAACRRGLLDKTPKPSGNWKGVTEAEVEA